MVSGKFKCIYGYEIGAILGVNKRKSVMEVYLEKVNEESENKAKTHRRYEAIYWGNTLKEIMCKEFTIRSGKKVRKDPKTIIDEEYNFMHCKVDRRIVGENSILMCIVCNGINSYEELNENVLLECQHNMRVTKADKCYIAYLINDEQFLFKEVFRDENLISKIIYEEKSFVNNHIAKEIPPKELNIINNNL